MIVALENIRSLYNIGGIFRTAEFFGIKQIWLIGYTGREMAGVDQLNHKLTKVSLGAEKNLQIKFFRHAKELINYSKKRKLSLIAIEQHPKSIPLQNWRPKPNSVLIFGSETNGVSPQILAVADQIVEIPRLGKKNSLNVATCAGIILAKTVFKLT